MSKSGDFQKHNRFPWTSIFQFQALRKPGTAFLLGVQNAASTLTSTFLYSAGTISHSYTLIKPFPWATPVRVYFHLRGKSVIYLDSFLSSGPLVTLLPWADGAPFPSVTRTKMQDIGLSAIIFCCYSNVSHLHPGYWYPFSLAEGRWLVVSGSASFGWGVMFFKGLKFCVVYIFANTVYRTSLLIVCCRRTPCRCFCTDLIWVSPILFPSDWQRDSGSAICTTLFVISWSISASVISQLLFASLFLLNIFSACDQVGS